MQWNNKMFPSLNAINGKPDPYESKGVIRHYHYRSYPILGPEIVETRIITCSVHACTTILYLSWYSTIKEAFNQLRYGRVYNLQVLYND